MGYFIYFILAIVLLFIFPGIISSFVSIVGFLFSFLLFPLDIISYYFYPVSSIVYLSVYIIFGYLMFEFIHHHLLNK